MQGKISGANNLTNIEGGEIFCVFLRSCVIEKKNINKKGGDQTVREKNSDRYTY